MASIYGLVIETKNKLKKNLLRFLWKNHCKFLFTAVFNYKIVVITHIYIGFLVKNRCKQGFAVVFS
jgi:hypothetical protein